MAEVAGNLERYANVIAAIGSRVIALADGNKIYTPVGSTPESISETNRRSLSASTFLEEVHEHVQTMR